MVTRAPAIAAPDESVTRPSSVPAAFCAKLPNTNSKVPTTSVKSRFITVISFKLHAGVRGQFLKMFRFPGWEGSAATPGTDKNYACRVPCPTGYTGLHGVK